ncbi:TPA: hypothetical protein CPT98_07395 [Candidatus Gastranaerophilales bacterium HUM_19]|nr:MAG TPA: hypothetical protein CPT97_10865 [Candidatus Gastranaerophilales bacterium HUM_17]DAB16785.1 MAG TPA: hypothetical protein CPT98_07395 [Candidatus Gastranaerophilales bacterium HUM_19]
MTEEKTYSQMRKEFQEVFFKKISPGLSKYESERLRQFGYTRAVKIAALIIILVLVFLTKQIDIGLIVFICCIAGAVCFGLKKKFENEIKQKIMPYVCKCLGDLKWKYAQCSFEQLLCKSGIIDRYNRVSYDDSFTGIYKDINYEICETSFYYTTGTGKNSSTRTVFKGVMIKLDMNKSFTGNTVIRPDTLKHASPAANLKHTTLEDVVFEKKFDVFTDDEVEARYLITPSFMERLNNMKTAFSADRVSCAFYDKYLLVGLHTSKDLFSICSLKEPVNDGKQFFTMFEEILSIIKLIDHFKLNQKIGL